MVINNLCSFSSIWAKSKAGPIYKPVEIGERCLLSGKPFGEYLYTSFHTDSIFRWFAVLRGMQLVSTVHT